MENLDNDWVKNILNATEINMDSFEDDFNDLLEEIPDNNDVSHDAHIDDVGVHHAHIDDAHIDDVGVHDAHIDDAHIDDVGVHHAHIDDAHIDDVGVHHAHIDDAHIDDNDVSGDVSNDASGDAHIDDNEIQNMITLMNPSVIHFYFIYIAKNLSIHKIITEKIELMDGIIPKELLFYLIQNKKKNKYKLFDILLYQINIDSIDSQFEEKLKDEVFLKIVPFIDTIQLKEQIHLLHSCNSIYVFYQEHSEETEIVNGKKTFKRVPYKRYTRKVKLLHNDNSDTVSLKDNSKKTRKKVVFSL